MRNFVLLLALTTPARCRRKHRQAFSGQSAPPPECTRASASGRLDQIHLRYWKAEPSSNFSENGVLSLVLLPEILVEQMKLFAARTPTLFAEGGVGAECAKGV